MLRDSIRSWASYAAMATVLLSAAACRDLTGQCSSRTDTLCLQLEVADRTTIPDDLHLTLSSGANLRSIDYLGIGATLAQRPYVVEVAFDSTPPAMLTINALGNRKNPTTGVSQLVASALVTLPVSGAARPTLISLAPVGQVGNDLGMSTDQAGADAATPPDLQNAWQVVYTSTGKPLNALVGINSATPTIYAAGNSGVVVRGDGTTFAPTANAGTGTLTGIWPASATEAFACDLQGVPYRTTTSGASWVAGTATGYALNGIYGRSASDVLAVGNSGMAAVQWDGTMWKAVFHNQGVFMNAVFASNGYYYIAEVSGNAARATNPMAIWNIITNGAMTAIRAINGLGATDNFTVSVSSAGTAHSYAGVGSMWTNLNSPVTTALSAVWVSAVSNVVVGGAGGVVLRYVNGTWSSISNSNLSGYNITGIWGDGTGQLWLSATKGSDGAIFKY